MRRDPQNRDQPIQIEAADCGAGDCAAAGGASGCGYGGIGAVGASRDPAFTAVGVTDAAIIVSAGVFPSSIDADAAVHAAIVRIANDTVVGDIAHAVVFGCTCG